MQEIRKYIAQNKQRFIDELQELLSIPSVSTDSKYKKDVSRAANFTADALHKAGADTVKVLPTHGHPVVYAEKIVNEKFPTVLVYGHYDVQPPDPVELWDSPPFQPVIRDEKIYARGASDDKGQMFMHIKALEILNHLYDGKIPCNIKFLIEGEEECGSTNLENFLKTHKEKLSSDIVLISDTAMLANDIPSITYAVRGLAYMEVELTGPNRDLHSGVYGGAVDNPINVLCEMIASLKNKKGKITLPHFYDDVMELSKEEKKLLRSVPFSRQKYLHALDIADTRGEKGYSVIEQISSRPTLDVNGIWGGYTAEGAKTVLPSKAHAKISMRLVPNQKSEKITQLFKKHFEEIAPKTVKVKVITRHGGEAAVLPLNHIGYKAASLAMQDAFGKIPVPAREGGSIPIVAMFDKILKVKSAMMGFGLNSDAIHAPNEHFGIFNFLKGIETIPRFHFHFAELKKNK